MITYSIIDHPILQKLWTYVRQIYPRAMFDLFMTTPYDSELHFYPAPEVDDVYCCLYQKGAMKILEEF